MADISVPGVKSRFDTEKIIDGLMKVERIPRDRIENSVKALEAQKTTWRTLGLRITAMREGANHLYSFQNPFNDRIARSSDDSVLQANANRDTKDQNHDFTVKQIAQADKLISNPLDQNYKVQAGTYQFSTGKSEVSFKFNGGTLQEWSDTLNRRAQDKINSYLVAVKPGTRSLVVESLVTGTENKLQFSADALKLALETGLVEEKKVEPEVTNISAVPVKNPDDPLNTVQAAVQGDSLKVAVNSTTAIAMNDGIVPTSSMILKFETSISDNPAVIAADEANLKAIAEAEKAIADREAAREAAAAVAAEKAAEAAEKAEAKAAEKAAAEAAAAAAEEDGIEDQYALDEEEEIAAEAAEEDAETAEIAEAEGDAEATEEIPEEEIIVPPRMPRVDDLQILTLRFSDGTSTELSPVEDSGNFASVTYNLFDISEGRTVSSIEIKNNNTHKDFSIRNIQVVDPFPKRETEPLNAITKAQDAILLMDGIEVERPTNKIDDLIPGLTLDLKTASEFPVNMDVQNNTEAIKDAVITLVGSYNRLMAELNVLTRRDEKILNEITYLNADERAELKEKLGLLEGDTAVNKLRSDLVNAVSASYTTSDSGNVLLASFGISTDARRAGASGYDPSRMRGYLEFDENVFDEAIKTNFKTLQQLMGRDTDGDMIIDSGLAYALDRIGRPFVETGGIVANKTSSIDSSIAADNRRISSMDRQLEQKEAALKRQYGQMEGAYNRMEQMSRSLDSFSNQNNANNK
jgi:flagellar hook-associated protein 2